MARSFAPVFALIGLVLAPPTARAAPPAPTAAPASDAPWLRAPFEASPAQVLAALGALDPAPKDAGVDVLLRRCDIRFDAQGRMVRRNLLVSHILTAAGAQSWATTTVSWVPWHQSRPTLRARVIRPDGRVYLLHPSTAVEDSRSDGQVFSDARLLRAPLPAVDPGSYVEEETVETDTEPAFDAGLVQMYALRIPAPVRALKVHIEAPAALPLKAVVRGTSAPLAVRSEGAVRTVDLAAGPLEPAKDPEPWLPADLPRGEELVFATGSSWAQVARSYAAIVEKAVGTAAAPPAAKLSVEARAQLLSRLLAEIRREVRYTSVALGRAAFEPRSPAQTLERKYGDCKDMATLLVARLREAGVPASVALLNTGPGEDILPDMPGFGLFDHAIVVVPGTPAVWVDPTARPFPPGTLPVSDQGRRALIADARTTALVTTPRATPADNRIRETTTYTLGEEGPASAELQFEAVGTIAGDVRGSLDRGEPDFKKAWEESLQRSHLAKSATVIEHSAAEPVDGVFRLRATMTEVRRAFSDDQHIEVALGWTGVLGELPDYLTEEPDDADAEAPTAERAARAAPLEIALAHTVDIGYRLVPPPGFVARPPPDSDERTLGPVRLSRRVKVNPDGTVAAEFHLESGAGRFTAEEAEQFHAAIVELKKKPFIEVEFDNRANLLRAAGKIREALQEHQRLAALHPKEALHHRAMSEMLLELGMGEAAVRAARRATELEPTSAYAFYQLGWSLEHDALGRRFEGAFDREGALAALRKAVELDPKNVGMRLDLAILYEHGRDGMRYWGQGAQLDEALREYRLIRDDLKSDKANENLLSALARAERWDEARKLASDLPAGAESRDDVLVTAAAALARDSSAAIGEAARLVPDPERRRKALAVASATLVAARRYPLAAELLRESLKGSSASAAQQRQLTLLARAHTTDPRAPLPREPEAFVRLFVVTALSDAVPEADLARFLAPRSRAGAKSAGVDPDLWMDVPSARAQWRRTATSVSPTVMTELVLGYLECHVDDQPWGARVKCPDLSDLELPPIFYLARVDGGLRVLATWRSVGLLGEEALRRLDAGDLVAARGWLDWARDQYRALLNDDPDDLLTFPLLWNNGERSPDDRARMAATALLAQSARAAASVDPLRAMREQATDPVLRPRLDRALALALYNADRDKELVQTLEPLVAANPALPLLFGLKGRKMIDLGMIAAAEAEAKKRLAAIPQDDSAKFLLRRALTIRGELDAVERLHREAVARGDSTSTHYNEIAWLALFKSPLPADAIENARKAATLTNDKDRSTLHTLAAVYAAADLPGEAMQTLRKSLAAGDGVPLTHDWFVVGRIAESYGLREDAIAAYRRVAPEKDQSPVDTEVLARRRLQGLQLAAQK